MRVPIWPKSTFWADIKTVGEHSEQARENPSQLYWSGITWILGLLRFPVQQDQEPQFLSRSKRRCIHCLSESRSSSAWRNHELGSRSFSRRENVFARPIKCVFSLKVLQILPLWNPCAWTSSINFPMIVYRMNSFLHCEGQRTWSYWFWTINIRRWSHKKIWRNSWRQQLSMLALKSLSSIIKDLRWNFQRWIWNKWFVEKNVVS